MAGWYDKSSSYNPLFAKSQAAAEEARQAFNPGEMLKNYASELETKQRQAKADERQAIADAQNKQLFDMKIAEANRVEKLRQDEEAYLKGVSQPDAYGMKAGTDQIVARLGQYGENPRAKVALAAGPGTPEYEQYFKEMAELGNVVTGTSLDDRTVGFNTANPNNMYAAKEALKANVSRQSALDAEAKSLADKKLQYALKGAELGAKGATTTATGKTASGYAVKDPGAVAKSSVDLVMKANDLDKLPSGMLADATRLANAGYDSAQTAQIINAGFTPSKSGFIWDDKAKFTPSAVQGVGAPRNKPVIKTTGGANLSKYNALAKTFDDRLNQVQTQRDGKVGLSELDRIIGNVPKASTAKSNNSKKIVADTVNRIVKSAPKVTKENKTVIKKAVESVINKPVPTKEGIEAIEKAAIAKKDANLQKRAQALKASLKTGGIGPISESNKAQWNYLIDSFTSPIKSVYDVYQENIGQPFSKFINKHAPGGDR